MLKRMRSLLLCMMVSIIATTPALAAKPLSPNTSFETTNGTIAPLAGEVVSGSGDGPGWAGPWVGEDFPSDSRYDNSRATTGQWSMMLDTTGTNNEPNIYRLFATPFKKGSVSFRMQVNSTGRNNKGVFISGGDPNYNNGGSNAGRAIFFSFAPSKYYNSTGGNGDLSVYDGQVEAVLADNYYVADAWYEVTIEFDCNKDGGVYDVYVDGDKVNASPLHFYAPQTSLVRLDVLTGASQNQDGSSPDAGTKLWIDDVTVSKKH
jgi:hypothetical protein